MDLGVPGGREMLDLVNVFFDGSADEQEEARSALLAAVGPEAFFDSATVFGNFEMMNRVAEGTGIPIAPQRVEREAEMMKSLGLYDILKSQQIQATE